MNVKKAVCINGHVIAVVGRNNMGSCRACKRATERHEYEHGSRRRVARRERVAGRLKKHGLTPHDLANMMDQQQHRCAICSVEFCEEASSVGFKGVKQYSMTVDHDHTTGKVRQLLCSQCNTGIGKLREDPWVLHRAIAYIERHA